MSSLSIVSFNIQYSLGADNQYDIARSIEPIRDADAVHPENRSRRGDACRSVFTPGAACSRGSSSPGPEQGDFRRGGGSI